MENKEEKKEVIGNGAIFDFLYAEAEKPREAEVRISERIPFAFKIRPLEMEEHKAFQKKATKTTIKGRNRSVEFNAMGYYVDCALACTLEPNFRDTKNISKAGVATPDMLLSKLLLPGEIIELASKITEISGFSDDINEDIEEAKN